MALSVSESVVSLVSAESAEMSESEQSFRLRLVSSVSEATDSRSELVSAWPDMASVCVSAA